MHKKKSEKSKVFYKMLISYYLVLFIPLIFILGLFYFIFLETLENEIKSNNKLQILQQQKIIDDYIEGLTVIDFQIRNSNSITEHFLDVSPLNVLKVIEQINNFTAGNNFIKDIFVVFDGNNTMYTTSTSIDIDYYFQKSLYDVITREEFLAFIDDDHTNYLLIDETTVEKTEEFDIERHVNVLFFKIDAYQESRKNVIFTIDIEKLGLFLKNYRGSNFMFDGNWQMIAQSEDGILNTDKIQESVGKNDEISDVVSLGKDKYFLASNRSKLSGWYYVSLIPFSESMGKLIWVKILFIAAISTIVVLTSLVILLSVKTNYEPIRRLKETALSIAGKQTQKKDEFEIINNTLAQMQDESNELTIKLHNTDPAVKEFLTLSLLQGSYSNETEIIEKAANIGMDIKDKYFQVILFKFSKAKTDMSLIVNMFKSSLPTSANGYAKKSVDADTLIFLLSFNTPDTQNILKTIQNMHSNLLGIVNSNLSVGIGNYYSQLSMIPKSYIEAKTALDYRLVKGNNRIITFEEISSVGNSSYKYPKVQIEALFTAIKNGDVELISIIVNEIKEIFVSNTIPVSILKCICYDIINTVIKAISDVNNRMLRLEYKIPDTITLTNFETIDELIFMIDDIVKSLCNHIQKYENSNDEDVIKRILDYIESNYTDYNFSINSMSQEFNMTVSNLSHYFKKHVNKTISDYITYLRMEKVKILLLTTDRNLKEIVEEIGYYDISSFVRKFKNYFGVTPGNYRTLYKIDEN